MMNKHKNPREKKKLNFLEERGYIAAEISVSSETATILFHLEYEKFLYFHLLDTE